MKTNRFTRSIVLVAALAFGAAACGTDDGASVTQLNDDTGESASGSGAASGSAPASSSAPAPADGDAAATTGDGGYDYASNVDSHRRVVLDVCAIKELLPSDAAIDYAAVDTVYREGVNSVNSDGSIRTIAGFASRDDRNPTYQSFFESQTPLDDFVTAAIEGTGPFEGESDLVRRQGIEKGIQNQIMVAWTIQEFNAAMGKAGEGNFDPQEGAPHNWDEAWAFYHGVDGSCGPFATGNSRAVNFGTTGANGETALANEMILDAMVAGRDALLAGDVDGADDATWEALKGLGIIYSQATLRYAQIVDDDLAEGNTEAARVHQAEGWAFSRVMAPYFADTGADMAAIDGFYNLENEPSAGGYELVEAALQPAWDVFGISADDIGVLG